MYKMMKQYRTRGSVTDEKLWFRICALVDEDDGGWGSEMFYQNNRPQIKITACFFSCIHLQTPCILYHVKNGTTPKFFCWIGRLSNFMHCILNWVKLGANNMMHEMNNKWLKCKKLRISGTK